MAKNDLTSQRVREVLDYSQESGRFTWKLALPRSKQKPGDLAGCVATDGYVVIGIYGHYYKAHRLAWLYVLGEWPIACIDHMNGTRDDNRWSNLRAASKSTNAQNVHGPSKRSSSGLLGVRKYGNKWRSAIMIDGVIRHLGTFGTPEQAHESYLQMKRKHHLGFLG